MDELSAIVSAIDECDSEPILATLVEVSGSSYRQPGARMLILPEDAVNNCGQQRIGMISGGCLERELCQIAPSMTKEGPRLVTIDTRANRIFPHGRFGSGCHGLLHVLLERLDRPNHQAVEQMKRVVTNKSALAVGVVCRSGGPMPPVGTRFELDSLSTCEGRALEWRDLFSQIQQALIKCSTNKSAVMTSFVTDDGHCDIFFHRITSAPTLWIFGAGDDALPLVALAEPLGMDVTVFDKRIHFLTPERIGPCATKCGMGPTEVMQQFVPRDETSIVIMTHSLDDDSVLLDWALKSSASYVGILGSKTRTGNVLRMCHEQGAQYTPHQLDKLRTPVGLDIGASNPAEIALSILAEMIAVRNNRDGSPLTRRHESIHNAMTRETVVLDETQRDLSNDLLAVAR